MSTVRKSLTIKAAFRLAMAEWEPWRSSKAQHSINANYKHVVAVFPEEYPLEHITQDRLRDFKTTMIEKGLAASTLNSRLSFISVLFKCASENGIHMAQPKVQRGKIRDSNRRCFTLEEEATARAHFDASTHPQDIFMRSLVPVLLGTGLRLSEALRLTPRLVDLDRGILTINVTKAERPRRIPMTAEVRDLIEPLVLAAKGPLAPIFGDLTVDSADHRWQEMRTATGMSSEVKLHCARHTCCSRLIAAGHSLAKVQKWMGHKNVNTTIGYTHLDAEDLFDLAEPVASKPSRGNLRSVQ